MYPTITVVATGDLHVCTDMKLAGLSATYGDEPLVLAQARRMLGWITAVTAEVGADFVLLGGDVYDGPTPAPAAEEVVQRFLAEVREVGAAPALLLGNHDRDAGGRRRTALAPLGSNIGRPLVVEHPGAHLLVNEATGARLALYCLPYPARAEILRMGLEQGLGDEHIVRGAGLTNQLISAALDAISGGLVSLARHHREASPGDGPRAPQALWVHGTVRGSNYGSRKVPESDPQVSTAGWEAFDVAACSHIHKRQPAPGLPAQLAETHGYIGAPDRFDAGERDQPAGVTVFRFAYPDGPEPVVSVEFVPNPFARRYVTVDVADFDPDAIAAELQGRSAMDVAIYQVKGQVSDDQKARLAVTIRYLKEQGALLADRTEVVRTDREARCGTELKADTSDLAVLKAAIGSQAELAPHEEDILGRFALLEGGGQ